MPNHFHILVREKMESGISKFMLKLSVGYSNYFNKKNFRRGSLFEGTFKARYIDSDRYLKYSYSYIHLNPIGIIDKGWKKKHIENISVAKKQVKEFHYSSYRDYLEEERMENKIINKEAFPKYFETINEFEEMMDFWIDNSEESFIH
jgi:putative transposase